MRVLVGNEFTIKLNISMRILDSHVLFDCASNDNRIHEILRWWSVNIDILYLCRYKHKSKYTGYRFNYRKRYIHGSVCSLSVN